MRGESPHFIEVLSSFWEVVHAKNKSNFAFHYIDVVCRLRFCRPKNFLVRVVIVVSDPLKSLALLK